MAFDMYTYDKGLLSPVKFGPDRLRVMEWVGKGALKLNVWSNLRVSDPNCDSTHRDRWHLTCKRRIGVCYLTPDLALIG